MNRRQLLAGLGAAAAGGGAALGTGAFTSVEAQRSVTVNVADEDQAYLGIDEVDGTTYPNATFATQNTKNEISLDFNDNTETNDGSEGVGLDSDYEFDNVFEIENQGTQEVEVSIDTIEPTSGVTVKFYDGTDASTSLDSDNGSPKSLGTGISTRIGVKIEVDEPSTGSYSADTTVSADAT
jgi:hypothetical protein